MPIYEYQCTACGRSEERIQGLSAPPRHDCTACGTGLGMERRVSRTAFVLSGGGWYTSGYGSAPQSDGKPDGAASSAPAAAKPCEGGCACHAGSSPGQAAAGNT